MNTEKRVPGTSDLCKSGRRPALLDHLVGAGEQRRRNFEAEHLGSLEVDDEFVLGRCLHRQVAGLFALEDAIDISSCAPELIDLIGIVGDETAVSDKAALEVDGGQPVTGRKLDDEVATNEHQPARCTDHPAVGRAREGRNCALHFRQIACVDLSYLYPQRRRQCLDDAELAYSRRRRRIAKHCDARYRRRNLLEQFQPFPADAEFECHEPGGIPPGLARFSTKPAPTGSATTTKTIGTVRVTCSNGPTVEAPGVRMTSGDSATNSAACLRTASAFDVAQRVSICTFRPMLHPRGSSPCRKAPNHAW